MVQELVGGELVGGELVGEEVSYLTDFGWWLTSHFLLTISHLKIDFSRSSHLTHAADSLVCNSSRPTEVEHNFSLSMVATYKPAYNSHCMANVWPRVDHMDWGNLPIHTKQESDFSGNASAFL